MRRILLVALVAGIPASPCVCADGEGFPYQVGQVWTYEHEGVQPWSDRDATGPYTRTVLRQEKVGDKTCWVIQEHYQKGDPPGEVFMSLDGLVIQQIVRNPDGEMLLEFQPPFEDATVTLKPGEEKQIERAIVFRALPSREEQQRIQATHAMKRLPDESVTVPAGTFPKCKRIMDRLVMHVEAEGVTIEVVGVHETWRDSKMGVVKETFVAEPIKGPDGMVFVPERKSKSVLKSFAVKEGAK